jgi:hypothetical protein
MPKVMVWCALNVELQRIVEGARIDTGSAQDRKDGTAARNDPAWYLDIGGRELWFGSVNRAAEAQEFLYGRADDFGFLLQLLERLGMLEQCEYTVGEKMYCGFVAGDDEQEDHRDELVFAEAFAVSFCMDQRGEDVVPGVGPLASDDAADESDGLGQLEKKRTKERPASPADSTRNPL